MSCNSWCVSTLIMLVNANQCNYFKMQQHELNANWKSNWALGDFYYKRQKSFLSVISVITDNLTFLKADCYFDIPTADAISSDSDLRS